MSENNSSTVTDTSVDKQFQTIVDTIVETLMDGSFSMDEIDLILKLVKYQCNNVPIRSK